MVIFFIGAISSASFAQEKEILERPADIGFENIDSWVNKCYDLYDETIKTDEEIKVVDDMFASFEEDASNVNDGGKANLKSSTDGLNTKVKEMNGQLKSLVDKSADMTGAAKQITPKTKVPKALKHVKSGMKALNAAKSNIPEQTKKIAAQTTKAKDYI